jgi:hypothetical protein
VGSITNTCGWRRDPIGRINGRHRRGIGDVSRAWWAKSTTSSSGAITAGAGERSSSSAASSIPSRRIPAARGHRVRGRRCSERLATRSTGENTERRHRAIGRRWTSRRDDVRRSVRGPRPGLQARGATPVLVVGLPDSCVPCSTSRSMVNRKSGEPAIHRIAQPALVTPHRGSRIPPAKRFRLVWWRGSRESRRHASG